MAMTSRHQQEVAAVRIQAAVRGRHARLAHGSSKDRARVLELSNIAALRLNLPGRELPNSIVRVTIQRDGKRALSPTATIVRETPVMRPTEFQSSVAHASTRDTTSNQDDAHADEDTRTGLAGGARGSNGHPRMSAASEHRVLAASSSRSSGPWDQQLDLAPVGSMCHAHRDKLLTGAALQYLDHQSRWNVLREAGRKEDYHKAVSSPPWRHVTVRAHSAQED